MIAACSESDTNPPAERMVDDVSYGPFARNKMDLNLPANRSQKTQVVVLVHGGGWREGSKADFRSIAQQFADNGYATVSIDYRYADADNAVDYTDLLQDIDQALLFLKENAEEYVLNPDHVTLFGHSAGAHLSLLYAYRNNERGQVKSVIALAAPTDLPALLAIEVFPSLLYNLVGTDDLNRLEDASPIRHIHGNVVPTYLFHGRGDNSIPPLQSEALFEILHERNGLVHKIRLFDGVGHDFSAETLQTILAESLAFI
ncbi:MAG TPA: alpha/beta hydrolase [Ohtaekwangia sp.]|nr:alpha/beta hydrolase [Ohtaekwangia sp.]